MLNNPAVRDDVSTDFQLLSQVRDGDGQALASLYDRHSKLVFTVAMRVCKDTTDAEDVLQEIFMQIWRNPQQFGHVSHNLGGWLAVTSRNRSIDMLRKRRPSNPLENVVLKSSDDPRANAMNGLMMERIRTILEGLSPEHGAVLTLAYFDGMSHSEIATKTGLPLGTVKTRIRSSLAAIRAGLKVQLVAKGSSDVPDDVTKPYISVV